MVTSTTGMKKGDRGTPVSSGKETKARTGPVKNVSPKDKIPSTPVPCTATGSRALLHVHLASGGAGRTPRENRPQTMGPGKGSEQGGGMRAGRAGERKARP